MTLESVGKLREVKREETQLLTLDPAESFNHACYLQREINALTNEQQAIAKTIKELKEQRDVLLSGQITFGPHAVTDGEREAA